MNKDFLKGRVIRRVSMVLGGIIFGALFAFLFGIIVLMLWNWLMPVIFGLPEITYLQAWGLVLLCHMLFKGGGHGGPHGHRGHHERHFGKGCGGHRNHLREHFRGGFEEKEPKE